MMHDEGFQKSPDKNQNHCNLIVEYINFINCKINHKIDDSNFFDCATNYYV